MCNVINNISIDSKIICNATALLTNEKATDIGVLDKYPTVRQPITIAVNTPLSAAVTTFKVQQTVEPPIVEVITLKT